MYRLLEKYSAVFEKIEEYHKQIAADRLEIKRLGDSEILRISSRIKSLQDSLVKTDEYLEEVNEMIRTAEMHLTSKNVPAIDIPDGYRININRLREWTRRIDPLSEDDPYARRVYYLANTDRYFLEYKKQEFMDKIVELDAMINSGLPQEIKKLEDHISYTQTELARYLISDDAKVFLEYVKQLSEDGAFSDEMESDEVINEDDQDDADTNIIEAESVIEPEPETDPESDNENETVPQKEISE